MRNRDFLARVFSIVAGLTVLALALAFAVRVSRAPAEDEARSARQERQVVELFKMGETGAYSPDEVRLLMDCARDPHRFRLAMALIHNNRAGAFNQKGGPEDQQQAKEFWALRNRILDAK